MRSQGRASVGACRLALRPGDGVHIRDLVHLQLLKRLNVFDPVDDRKTLREQ